MDIVSYRGPGAAGGVSSGLDRAWRTQRTTDSRWWFLEDDGLKSLGVNEAEAGFITQIAEPIVKGHYRFCNEFVWPIMHDLPLYAVYRKEDGRHYRKFNRLFGQFIGFEQNHTKRFFINDYQLALLPRYLNREGGRSFVFWHIPWPKQVREEHVDAICEIALGLLKAERVGFHTNEYARNFMQFVRLHLRDFRVEPGNLTHLHHEVIASRPETDLRISFAGPYVTRPLLHPTRKPLVAGTQVVAQPLGIDYSCWESMAASTKTEELPDVLKSIADQRLILSVDRVDYTKSVFERLEIIDRFFERRPNWRSEVSFVQVCQRSRKGLPAFDQYWDDCHKLATHVNDKWKTEDWQPITWIEQPVSADVLAQFYRHADGMLVNPVRDVGLNLTAKEFAACQNGDAGVLMLSPGTGAWCELGKYALPANPLIPEEMLNQLNKRLLCQKLSENCVVACCILRLRKIHCRNGGNQSRK